jgi:hypothetical protein
MKKASLLFSMLPQANDAREAASKTHNNTDEEKGWKGQGKEGKGQRARGGLGREREGRERGRSAFRLSFSFAQKEGDQNRTREATHTHNM